jgi:aryl-phospho-beta-D-glucosidase BglC (GH1 family)
MEEIKMIKNLLLIVICIVYINVVHAVDSKTNNVENNDFLRTLNDKIVLGEDTSGILLRGVNFSPSHAKDPHENDYKDVVSMNMNAVRIALRYSSFYDPGSPNSYKESAWKWLDENIRLARKYQVYLILILHEIEGAQFVPNKDVPYDYRVWEDKQLQNNFISLWHEIANRYKDETQIAGYNLFCEPVCSETVDQWKSLAYETINEIRKVDKNHIIFIERIYGENRIRREVSKIELPIDTAFFLVDDENVVYEFYFFERDEYTHQFASYRPEPDLQISRTYPDSNMTIIYQEENAPPDTFGFTREYLEHHLNKHLEFGKKNNVPMCVWGFGANRYCFQNNRGGLKWFQDVIELFNKNNLHWNIVAYKHSSYGINNNDALKNIIRNQLTTGIKNQSHTQMNSFQLCQNFPNPFSKSTKISFELPGTTEVELAIFDIMGRRVRTLGKKMYDAGTHSIIWHGEDETGNPVSSGIYFFYMKANQQVFTQKVLLLKKNLKNN